jgi:hypothetical protein
MPELAALPGGPGQFACTWCGATFERRWIASDGVRSLEEHWATSTACSANRTVNNPTQSKYDVVDGEMPGLRLPDGEDRDA